MTVQLSKDFTYFPGESKILVPNTVFYCKFLKGNCVLEGGKQKISACGALRTNQHLEIIDFSNYAQNVYLIAN